MSKLQTIEDLLLDQLKDIHSAETQITKALPKMMKAATTAGLKQAFETHLKETEGQIERLDKIGEMMGKRLTGKTCKAMQGLIEEGKECMEMDGVAELLDAALISAAQRVEHYEISAYGTARTIAKHLGLTDVVEMLQETLDEESKTDELLTDLSLNEVMPAAEAALAGDDSSKSGKSGSTAKSRS